MRRIHIAWLPPAEYLALELTALLGLDHLPGLCWAVETGFSCQASCEGHPASSLRAGRGVASSAVAENGQEGVIWRVLGSDSEVMRRSPRSHLASEGLRRSIACMSCRMAPGFSGGVAAETCWRICTALVASADTFRGCGSRTLVYFGGPSAR